MKFGFSYDFFYFTKKHKGYGSTKDSFTKNELLY